MAEQICPECKMPRSSCICQPDKFGQNRQKHYNNIEVINNNFVGWAPSHEQLKKQTEIRENSKMLALILNRVCPDSREKSLAMTKLEECVMWAIEAIGRNE